MPQLDAVSFLTQYFWTLGGLFLLFSMLILYFLPKTQKQIKPREFVETSLDQSNSSSHLNLFIKILKY
uniref:ATP synthase F0 subunit 8 n=1 Tax=Igernella notabilis TaxID=479643 RepID=I6LIQ9_9METZ|nr:ATP synthase F0 subunit 8 [Igernella notabilis]ABW83940.1 ATP synthase F0 subunit 8 [Igernella notabilis]